MSWTTLTARQRSRGREEGFTLIELMVVVLIIAILIAIAIPTFLGARNRAENRAAQSSLRNALSAAKTIFTDKEDYTLATPAALTAVEPSVAFVAAGANSTNDKMVSVGTPDADTWIGAVKSKSGTCFFLRDNTVSSGTTYDFDAALLANCNANSAPGNWASSW